MEAPSTRLIRYIQGAEISDQELTDFVRHRPFLIRANALLALAERARIKGELVDVVSDSATDPTNEASLLLGTITVAHVAIACLFRIGTPAAIAEAERIVGTYTGTTKEDLIWYLRSEKLLPPYEK